MTIRRPFEVAHRLIGELDKENRSRRESHAVKKCRHKSLIETTMSVKKWISDAVLQAPVDRSRAEISRTSDLDSEKVVTHPYPLSDPFPKKRKIKKAKQKSEKKKMRKEKKLTFIYVYTEDIKHAVQCTAGGERYIALRALTIHNRCTFPNLKLHST
jgi:hypothetical protein